MQECGVVNRVTILTDKFGGAKGYAYIEFEKADAAVSAVLLDGSSLRNREIKVAFQLLSHACWMSVFACCKRISLALLGSEWVVTTRLRMRSRRGATFVPAHVLLGRIGSGRCC